MFRNKLSGTTNCTLPNLFPPLSAGDHTYSYRYMSCENLPLDFFPKHTPYEIPPSALSVNPHTMRIRKQNHFQAPIFVRESFEVVVPSSPLTDIGSTAVTTAEEVPAAQVERSLNELAVTMKLAESRINHVVTMRERQATIVASRERLIDQLDEEVGRLDREMISVQEKIAGVESEIVKVKTELGILPCKFRCPRL